MVKRYHIADTVNDLLGVENEEMVKYEDYQSLQAALREALEGWASWTAADKPEKNWLFDEKRIAELRKLLI